MDSDLNTVKIKTVKFIIPLCIVFFSSIAQAQQNYFNVPSFEITRKGHFFFQQQLNVNDFFESNSTFDWGLWKHVEAGFNIYGVKVNNPLTTEDDANKKFEQLTMMNIQAVHPLSHHYFLGLGAQYGYRHSKFHSGHPAGSIYGAFVFDQPGRFNYVLGPWFGTKKYLGTASRGGVQAGAEWHVKKDSVALVIDSIAGDAPLCVTVLGLNFHVARNWILSTGYQLPNNKIAEHAIVFELTYKEAGAKSLRKTGETPIH